MELSGGNVRHVDGWLLLEPARGDYSPGVATEVIGEPAASIDVHDEDLWLPLAVPPVWSMTRAKHENRYLLGGLHGQSRSNLSLLLDRARERKAPRLRVARRIDQLDGPYDHASTRGEKVLEGL